MPLLDTALLKDTRDFAALEGEWQDLYQDSPLATPFQSWEWLYSWWEAYGEGYELRLVTMRAAGLLVGLIPLMLERRWGFGRLLFIGTGLTDHLDVLVRRGWENQVAEVGRRVLQQMGSWHIADLQELHPTAAAWNIFHEWAGPQTCVWQSNCMVADIKPWDELLMSVKPSLRKTARRTRRRAETDGLTCKQAALAETKAATRRFVTLHREQWGKQIVPEHLTQRFESHLAAATARMTARGSGGIFEFWNDTEVIASCSLVWREGGFVGVYLTGANEGAHQRYQVSSLYMWSAVNVALSQNSTCVSLLRGEEPYKLWWNPRVVPNYRLILGQNLIPFAPYGAYRLLRSRAVAYAESEDTPVWIKRVVELLKRFRRV